MYRYSDSLQSCYLSHNIHGPTWQTHQTGEGFSIGRRVGKNVAAESWEVRMQNRHVKVLPPGVTFQPDIGLDRSAEMIPSIPDV